MDGLNRAVQVGPYPADGLPLGGKTLLLGAHTVTFPGDANANVTFAQFMEEIAKTPGLKAYARRVANPPGPGRYMSVALAHDDGVLIKKDGTGNQLLGLSTTDDRAGKKPFSADVVKSIARTSTSEYEAFLYGEDADLDG